MTQQCLVDDELSDIPRFLATDSANNTVAFAHAMRLASYEYPLAFGVGYKKFPISKFVQHCYGSVLLGVGTQKNLQAGICASHIDSERGNIDFLFRFRETTVPDASKRLLSRYLTFARTERSYESIGLEVVSRNLPARELYAELGFVETSKAKGKGHSIIDMELPSLKSIDYARKKLQG